MTRIQRCAVLLALFAIFIPAGVAQDKAESDLTSLSLEQLMKVQFYTASKHAQDESETPASVTIITRAEIRSYGYRTLADVLQGVRGFWVTSDRNYSYLGVRGFARPGDYNDRILLLVNGHRLNDNVFDEALIGTEFPLDLDLVERIEIVRGPGSSLYGTNALLGVINVITMQPPITPTLEVSAEAENLLTRKGRITLGLPKLLDGAEFSASMYRSPGNQNLYFPEFDSPDTNHGVAHNVDGDSYNSAFALLHWKHFQLQSLVGSREKIIPTASFGTIFNDPGSRTKDARGFSELSYQRDFASGLQLTSRWTYDGYLYRGTYAYVVNGSRVLEYDNARGDWVGTDNNISRPIGHRNTVTAGMEFRYNLKQAQKTWFGSSAPVLDSHEQSSIFALYAQDELRVSSRLLVNAGLRFDQYSTFGSTVNPRVAAILHADSKTSIKYTFGTAFRAPNAYEQFYSDGVTQEPNTGLRPEKIMSQDVGVERVLTHTFHAAAEAYYNVFSHMVNDQIDPVTGLYQYVNISSSSGKGIEFELAAQHKRIRGQISYSVQRSIDRQTRAELSNSPQHIGKMNVQMPFPPALLAGFAVQYLSSQQTLSNLRVPDSLIMNLSVSTRKPIFGFDLSASCYNLANRRNYDPPSPSLVESRLLQDSRGFRFQIVRRIASN